MSTMLSDKAEQLNPEATDLHEELKRWKQEVLDAIDERFDRANQTDALAAPIVGHTSSALTTLTSALREDARELAWRAEDYLVAKPVKSLCIAAGVGFVLGALWSR